jgi:hypothetical protein
MGTKNEKKLFKSTQLQRLSKCLFSCEALKSLVKAPVSLAKIDTPTKL